MKLELKYFAAYLPHKLKCTCIKSDSKFVKDFGIKEIIGLSFNINRECFVGIFQNSELDINKIIPFLHPLSDLTKEIEVNGEKFIPIVELLKLDNPQWLERHPNGRYSEIEYSQNEVLANATFSFQATLSIHLHLKSLENERSWKIEKLKEWHFDTFGLIDNGLAVDINTVKF